MIKTVITKRSGVVGWQAKLHEVYSSYAEFESYDEIYNVSKRIGYKSTKSAWKKNPLIEGSINPYDLRKIR